MKKVIVGIPKALLFYHYKSLWLEFFNNLQIEVLISPDTNKQILENGSKHVVDEACLSLKIFMGHIDYLKDKVDYILIPRIECVKLNEKVCTNFLALYDLVNNVFNDIKILNYNVDLEKGESQVDGFIKIGKELGFSYIQTLSAYNEALVKFKKENQKKISINDKKLKSDKLKILVAAHPYNLHDALIGQPIIDYLKQENISVLTSDIYDDYSKFDCKEISKTIYWTYNKRINAAILKYKDFIDGIILLSTFPCGPDSLCNELIIRKIKSVPILYITKDDSSSDAGLITRLESFIDIIKLKKQREQVINEKNNN